MIMSGMPVVAAKHGLASEIPAWSASGVRAQVEAIKRLANETDESLEEQSDRISKWARRECVVCGVSKSIEGRVESSLVVV